MQVILHTNIIRTREALLERIPKGSTCAELGVFEGEFTKHIVEIVKPKELWLVDPFDGEYYSGDKNGLNGKTSNLVISYSNLKGLYHDNPAVKFYRGKSNDFFDGGPSNYYDFIYIDAEHSYEAAVQDLDNSFVAIKHGGYICGHDYTPIFGGVVLAVDRFCRKHNLTPEITTEDGLPSFLIKIP